MINSKLNGFISWTFTRKQVRIVGLVDHYYLFICVRMALVRGKIEGVSRDRFVQVAESGNTPLTRSMIVDGLEPQSEDFAQLIFWLDLG